MRRASTTEAGEISTTVQSVPFVTVRNRTGSRDVEDYFGDDRGRKTAGLCDVTHLSVDALSSVAENAPFYVPDSVVTLGGIRELPVEQILDALTGSTEGRLPVLYTHGYYISFDRGCKRASLFQANLGLDRRMLLFSWPSDGALLNYTRDEADLYWSVQPMKETLLALADRFGPGGFDVAAHSLGTRGIFLALVQTSDAEVAGGPLVNRLVLLAPDLDAGIFKQHQARIRALARHVTIYVSGNDKPLALSAQVHGSARLGQAGPHLWGLEGVEIVDISDIPVRYPSGHVYHLYHRAVVEDLRQLLDEGKTAPERRNLLRSGPNRWRLLADGSA